MGFKERGILKDQTISPPIETTFMAILSHLQLTSFVSPDDLKNTAIAQNSGPRDLVLLLGLHWNTPHDEESQYHASQKLQIQHRHELHEGFAILMGGSHKLHFFESGLRNYIHNAQVFLDAQDTTLAEVVHAKSRLEKVAQDLKLDSQ